MHVRSPQQVKQRHPIGPISREYRLVPMTGLFGSPTNTECPLNATSTQLESFPLPLYEERVQRSRVGVVEGISAPSG